MTRYPVKILMAFGCTFEPGSDEIFEWLMKNGYPELGAFSRAIQGEAKAKEWLMKNGFLQLVAIDSVIDKDENAGLCKSHQLRRRRQGMAREKGFAGFCHYRKKDSQIFGRQILRLS